MKIKNLKFKISSSGFTLIELIIVISITAVLSVVGIASFVAFSRATALSNAVADVSTTLQTAKSRAQSQSKPKTTFSDSCNLSGYEVKILTDKRYSIAPLCSDDSNLDPLSGYPKTLPPEICFEDVITPSSVKFYVLTGNIIGAGNIKIKGYGSRFTITVTDGGNISDVKNPEGGSC